MQVELVLVAAAALITSFLLTGLVRTLALKRGMLDVPNARSSHTVPTPSSGGIAIALTSLAAAILLFMRGYMDDGLFVALVSGGGSVAMVGFIDDRYHLSPSLRLAVHTVAAVWALSLLSAIPKFEFGDSAVDLGWGGYLVALIFIVWMLNLFNFMDGIDGIAASETIFVTWGALIFSVWATGEPGSAVFAAIVGASCVGFLVWNWAPAKIFMGDVGSGYLGYVVAISALAAGNSEPVLLIVWATLSAVFVTDSTVTLLLRLARGERPSQAHRTHAYQRLARRLGHGRVTGLVFAVNVLWLFPCALLEFLYPHLALWIALIAYLPLIFGVVAAGAGRAEY